MKFLLLYFFLFAATDPAWQKVAKTLPPPQRMVLGYAKAWEYADNPTGVRDCFITREGKWYSAEFYDCVDAWTTDTETKPTHWKFKSKPNAKQ